MNKFIKITSVIMLLIFLRVSFALAAEQVYFYYTDPAGTPLAMSDSSGAVVWRADYMPFGEESINSSSTVPNNKMFVGKEKDSETGMYYFGARYMDSGAGRFISTDVIGPVDPKTGKINEKILANSQMLNRYAYSINNPYRYVDKDGQWPERIHNALIMAAFSNGDHKLSGHVINIFQQASAYADSSEFQATKYSYMHSMNTSIYSPEMAEKYTSYYIEGKIAEYKRLMAQNNWVATDKAYFELGMAMHAIMDSTSPTHEGYQSWGGLHWWDPVSWVKGAEHWALEQYDTDAKDRETVRLLQNLYDRANH